MIFSPQFCLRWAGSNTSHHASQSFLSFHRLCAMNSPVFEMDSPYLSHMLSVYKLRGGRSCFGSGGKSPVHFLPRQCYIIAVGALPQLGVKWNPRMSLTTGSFVRADLIHPNIQCTNSSDASWKIASNSRLCVGVCPRVCLCSNWLNSPETLDLSAISHWALSFFVCTSICKGIFALNLIICLISIIDIHVTPGEFSSNWLFPLILYAIALLQNSPCVLSEYTFMWATNDWLTEIQSEAATNSVLILGQIWMYLAKADVFRSQMQQQSVLNWQQLRFATFTG